jgi:hypothetical protein
MMNILTTQVCNRFQEEWHKIWRWWNNWLGNTAVLRKHWCQGLHPEDESSMGLWNIRILPQHYMASQPRRPQLETSQPWKPRNSHQKTMSTIYLIWTTFILVSMMRNWHLSIWISWGSEHQKIIY